VAKLVRDLELAARLRAATGEGETVVEGGEDRFLVVRIPQTIELDDPGEIKMALEAAGEYLGPRYNADEVIALLRHEVTEDYRAP
jgi:hypothetical protein